MSRRPGLDVIRLVAIAAVVLYHLGLFDKGYLGVDLFFVLSGWLIGGQLLRSNAGIFAFWRRRWLRTLPSYFAVLILAVAFGRVSIWHAPEFAIFTQGYVDPWRWVVTWSLCVEEHFYLVLPLAMAIPSRSTRVGILLAAMLGSPILRAFAYVPGNFSPFYFPTHVRLDGLAIGVGMAAISGGAWERRVDRRLLAALGVFLIAGGVAMPGLYQATRVSAAIQFLVVSLGVGAMLPLAAKVQAPAWLTGRLGSVSEHTYAVYLVHLFAIELVSRFGMTGAGRVSSSLLVTGLSAWILRAAIEKPFLSLRGRMLAVAHVSVVR